MKKNILSLIVGFVVMMIVATLVTVASMPFLNELFGDTIRTQDTLLTSALNGGYFLLVVFMIYGFKKINFNASGWLKKGMAFGLFIGLIVFFIDHIIISGWSKLPFLPMFVSGIVDVIPTVATGIVISYFHKEN